MAWLVAGLGNPGPEYERTPHNLGFLAVDRFAERNGIRITRPECKAWVGVGKANGVDVVVAKPQTFMNLSGVSVRALLDKYALPLESLLLVYDELALPFGQLRIRPKGSAAGHNGVSSVIQSVGSEEFCRLRIGCSPGHKGGKEYLLSPMRRELTKDLDSILDVTAQAIETITAKGAEQAMAIYNRRAQSEPETNG
ncbi:MAG: aminoacyl-tRNA hydrolase [Bryobacteraceae bacterium]|nr:aminoacyl-tRNA hydrolase [Bryobacteraceae bacterium]